MSAAIEIEIAQPTISLHLGDCLEVMPSIPDGSVDAIICDLPYGTTACKWDVVIPFEPLWKEYKRVIKKNGAIVLFGSQPFTSLLVTSNPSWFRYEWVWQKSVGSNFAQVKTQPMKEHESVLVFGVGILTYNPIKESRKGSGLERLRAGYKSSPISGLCSGNIPSNRTEVRYTEDRYPSSVQAFNNREDCRGLHPTQKPVALLEYLIKTYTNEGETVMDNCMGSGTTGVACVNLGRSFIGIEKDKDYFAIAQRRIAEAQAKQAERLFR